MLKIVYSSIDKSAKSLTYRIPSCKIVSYKNYFLLFLGLNELSGANKTKLSKRLVQLFDVFIIWFLNRRVSGIVRNAANGSYAQL